MAATTIARNLELFPETPPVVKSLDIAVGDTTIQSSNGPAPTTALKQSIERLGVLVPVMAIEQPGEWPRYRIIAGRRRYMVAQELGLETIPARVFPEGTPPALIALTEQYVRENNYAAELQQIETLLDNGCTVKEICAATGLTASQVKARLDLKRLVPDLMRLFLNGNISHSIAVRSSNLSVEQQERLVAVYRENGKLRDKDVTAASRAQRAETVSQVYMEMGDFDIPTDAPPTGQQRLVEAVESAIACIEAGNATVAAGLLKGALAAIRAGEGEYA